MYFQVPIQFYVKQLDHLPWFLSNKILQIDDFVSEPQAGIPRKATNLYLVHYFSEGPASWLDIASVVQICNKLEVYIH